MKRKGQKDIVEFLNSPGVLQYNFYGKVEQQAAKRLEEKGIVTISDERFVSRTRFNRKYMVTGIVKLAPLKAHNF